VLSGLLTACYDKQQPFAARVGSVTLKVEWRISGQASHAAVIRTDFPKISACLANAANTFQGPPQEKGFSTRFNLRFYPGQPIFHASSPLDGAKIRKKLDALVKPCLPGGDNHSSEGDWSYEFTISKEGKVTSGMPGPGTLESTGMWKACVAQAIYGATFDTGVGGEVRYPVVVKRAK
jgi:hypothetical protein